MVVRYLEQGGGVASEGLRKLIPCVEKTPVAAGVDGIFVKVHDDPLSSPVDGPTQWPLRHFEELLEELIAIAFRLCEVPTIQSVPCGMQLLWTRHVSFYQLFSRNSSLKVFESSVFFRKGTPQPALSTQYRAKHEA
ncbi:hypothetical protein Vadar_012398 [Vaccinium darrowii]|uniref:Uncharacterized protein n=1 Tax=Vaccinium darrowii TaxID=229202 RepID=A0ACB7XQ43_9ERIC|nr:hypothetical protein Vadar_012398 [Vaccinium darrowii]